MSLRYYNDLRVGDTFDLGSGELSAIEIAEFTERYDPQPQYRDESIAGPLHGGFVASPWQAAALAQSLLVADLTNHVADLGHFGVSDLAAPARACAGISLRGEASVIEHSDSDTTADRGRVAFKVSLLDDKETTVLSFVSHMQIAKKPRST